MWKIFCLGFLLCLSAGTAPAERIIGFERGTDGKARVTWESYVGVEYRLQFSHDLSAGSFSDVAMAVADSATTSLSHSPGTSSGFYRIVCPLSDPIVLYGNNFVEGVFRPLSELTQAKVIEEGNAGDTADEMAARFAAGPHTDTLSLMLAQPVGGSQWTAAGVAAGYVAFRDAVATEDGKYIVAIPANRRPHDGTGWDTSGSYIADLEMRHEEVRELIKAQHPPAQVFDWWRWATRSYTPLDADDADDMLANGESLIPRSLRNHAGGDGNGDSLNLVGRAWLAKGINEALLRLAEPERFTATDKLSHFFPLDGIPSKTQIDVVGGKHGVLQGSATGLSREDGRYGLALDWAGGGFGRYVAEHFELGDEFAFDVWVKPETDGTRIFQMFGGGGGFLLITSEGKISFRAGVFVTEVVAPYELGEWNHVYGERVAGELRLRVNGGETVVKPLTTMEWGTDPLFIGSNNTGSSNFRGCMHSLGFFDRPLTTAEFDQRYNGGLGALMPGIQGDDQLPGGEGGEHREFWNRVFGAENLIPELDEDQDGQTNGEESDAGSDPFDPESVFKLVGEVTVESGATVLRWPGAEDRLYQLQNRVAGDSEPWADLGQPLEGIPGPMFVALEAGQLAGYEFRLEIEMVSGTPQPGAGSLLATHDSDGDGYSDHTEFIARTDPENPDSNLELVIETDAAIVVAQVETVLGMRYQLQCLSAETWVDEGGAFRGTGGVVTRQFVSSYEETSIRFLSVDPDSDGDGASDWREFWAGSDPSRIESVQRPVSDLDWARSVVPVPEIRLEVENGTANATSGRPGSIIVRRRGWAGAINVDLLLLGGTASAGSDYEALPSSVFLADGVKQVEVQIHPIAGSGSLSETLIIGATSGEPGVSVEPVEVRILRESVLDVTDFGTVGDGVADDTAAVQAAFDLFASDPSYNRLHFPEGRYRLGTSKFVSQTWTSRRRIIGMSHAGMDDRDLLITGDPGAVLFSTVSPMRAHMLEIKARYRSLRFEGLTFEKDSQPLEFMDAGAEPNGADAVSMLAQDTRRIDSLEFHGCTFINCHGAVFMYAQGYDLRGRLERFNITDCSILNPYGSNTVDSTSANGGGQQFYLSGWVGRATYRNNLFDGGADDMTDAATTPGGRVKDAGHFGSPHELVFEDNIVKRMGVEALFHTNDTSLMGITRSSFTMPPADGTTVEVTVTSWPTTFLVGDQLNLRTGFVAGMLSTNNLLRVAAYDGESNLLTLSNTGDPGNVPAGTAISTSRIIFRDTEYESGKSVIRRNLFDGTVPPGGFVSPTYIGIVTNSHSVISDNLVIGFGRAFGVYGEVHSPAHPGSRGTVVRDNVILTRDPLVPGDAYTMGVYSTGLLDTVSDNFILFPTSWYAMGLLFNGERTVASGNRVVAADIRRNGYRSLRRSLGCAFGTTAERVEFRGNSTRGFDVGVGHGVAFQNVPHLVLDHMSFLDALGVDPIGVVTEWPE